MTSTLLSFLALLFSSIAMPQFASILPQQEIGGGAGCTYASLVTLVSGSPYSSTSIKVTADFYVYIGGRTTISPTGNFKSKVVSAPNGAVITPGFVESVGQQYTDPANMQALTGLPACSPPRFSFRIYKNIIYPVNCYGGSYNEALNTCSSCGTGYERTGDGKCVQKFCPAGQVSVNGICVQQVSCTNGKELNAERQCVCPAATHMTLPNGQCVRKTACPANATVDANNRCACNQGYTMNAKNDSCLVKNNCYGGFYIEASNRCVSCGAGYLLRMDGTCVAKTDCHGGVLSPITNTCITCGIGSTKTENGQCTKTICPEGQIGLYEKCVVKTDCYGGAYINFMNRCSSCGMGYTLQTNNGTCAPTVCPAGKSLVNGVCAAIESGGCIFRSHIAIGSNGDDTNNASIALRGVRFTIFRSGNAGSTDTYVESPKSFYNKIVPTPDGGKVTRGFLDTLIRQYTDPKNMPTLTGLPACTSPAYQMLVWNSIYPPIPCTDGKVLLNQMCVVKADCRGGAYVPSTNTCSTCGTGFTKTADGRCTETACGTGSTQSSDGTCIETACPAGQIRLNGQCIPKTNCFGGTYVPATNTCGSCGTGYMRTPDGTCAPTICPAGKTVLNGICVTPDCSALAYREGGPDYTARTQSVTNTNATCGCYYREYTRYTTIRYQDLKQCPVYEQQWNGGQSGGGGGSGGYGGSTPCAAPRMVQNGTCACPPAAPVYEATTNICHAACAAPRSFWNGQQCTCPAGKVWDQPTQSCHMPCVSPLSWNGQQCACPKETIFNKQTNTCDPVTNNNNNDDTNDHQKNNDGNDNDRNDGGNNDPLCTLPLVYSKGGCVNPQERCTTVGRLMVIPSPVAGGMRFLLGVVYYNKLPLDAAGRTMTTTSTLNITGPFPINTVGIPAGKAAISAAVNSIKTGGGAPHSLCTSYTVSPYQSVVDLSKLARSPWMPE